MTLPEPEKASIRGSLAPTTLLANPPTTLHGWKLRVGRLIEGPVDDDARRDLRLLLDEKLTAGLKDLKLDFRKDKRDAFDTAFSELVFKAIEGKPEFLVLFIKSADFRPDHKSGVAQITALHKAVEEHNQDAATKILRKDPGVVDECDRYGQTALHYAAKEADGDMIALLLENRAKVDAFDSQHITPLHVVSGIDKWPTNVDRAHVAKLLVDNGAEVNTRDIFGESPLHDAARGQDAPVMKILLQHGADAEGRNFKGQTPRDLLPRSVAPWILDLLTRPTRKWSAERLTIPTTPPRCWNRLSSDASSAGDDEPSVCQNFFATVHFFYRKRAYSFSRSVSIHALLHDDEGEMERLEDEFVDLVGERFNDGQIRQNIWKWVHMPANQMSWVTDLVWRLTDDGSEQPIARKEAWKFLERNVTQRRGVKPGSYTRVPHAGDRIKRSETSETDKQPSKSGPTTGDAIRLYRRESWRNTTTFPADQKFSLVVPYIDFETEQYLERHDIQTLGFQEKCELEDRSLPYNGLYGLDRPRTLDESYYDMIPDDELGLRDRDQVVFKWFKDIVENDALEDTHEKLLDTLQSTATLPANAKDPAIKFRPDEGVTQEAKDTVMASRQARLLMVHQLWLWKLDSDTVITAFPDRYHQGVEDTLVETIRQGDIDSYTKPEQLIENILFECVTFLEEFRYAGLGIHVLDIFESSIAKRSHQEAVRYTDFRDSLDQGKRLPEQVRGDIQLIHEIKDIRDELSLLMRVFETQLAVVKQFADVFWSGDKRVVKKGRAFIDDSGVQRLIDRTRELDDRAKRALEDLDTLVQMKQAQSSLEEAATAGRLNNYIFLFTLVTIVFTPLSFMTSLFTVPFASFPQNTQGEIRVEPNWITRHLVYGEIGSLGGILLIGAGLWAYQIGWDFEWKKYVPQRHFSLADLRREESLV